MEAALCLRPLTDRADQGRSTDGGRTKQSGRGKGDCEPLNWKEAAGRDGHKDTATITAPESCGPGGSDISN